MYHLILIETDSDVELELEARILLLKITETIVTLDCGDTLVRSTVNKSSIEDAFNSITNTIKVEEQEYKEN
jgi:hypothetical protein